MPQINQLPSVNAQGLQQNGSTGINQLYYLYTVSGSIDIYLLKDVAYLCDFIARGRYLGYGLLNFKDVSNIAILVDMIARYLLDNNKYLTETMKSSHLQV